MSYQGPVPPGGPAPQDPWASPQPAPWGYDSAGQPPPPPGQPDTSQPYSGPPGYDQTGYGHDQGGYQAPAQPVSGQPVSGQPTSGQPVSGQPGYGYGQPGYPPPPPPPAGYGPGGYGPGGYGQQVPSTPDERNMAMLSHVLGILFGFLGPVIIYAMKKDESRFVRHHAADALNVTLTALIISFGITIMGCVLSLVLIGFLVFLLLIPYGILLVVYMIIAAMAANRGELYSYPAWLRFPMVS